MRVPLGCGTDVISVLGIFVYGCMASMHCIGMCGGMILSVTVREKDEKGLLLKKQAAYHLGRLLAGVFWGIFLGFTGELFVLNPYFKGLFPAVCGMIMIYMGFSHLGMIDRISLPVIHSITSKLFSGIKRKGALPAGILTGLLPCGMLNTVQVYAAGTGSVAEACICMTAFIIGTIPLLVLFGTLHAAITGRARRITVKISGVITVLLGLRLLGKAMGIV